MAEFIYAYLKFDSGIIRLKIPITINSSIKSEAKLVCFNFPKTFPADMVHFSHNHILYMVGGHDASVAEYKYSNLVYIFDPTKFDEFKDFPLDNIEQLPDSKFAPMAFPLVIRAKAGFYLLTYTHKLFERASVPMHLQYFDPIQKLFETGPPPPPLPPDCLRSSIPVLCCYFFIRGYIYLGIKSLYHRGIYAFKFNTMEMESKWEDCNAMVDRFVEKNIRFPYHFGGDIGISNEFADNTWILVALNAAQPTAYRVRLSDNGDIDPISSRILAECETELDDHIDDPYLCEKQLSDIGGGRFCVMRSSSSSEYLIYVFSIDFSREYDIQISGSGVGVCSSDIIFSMIFKPDEIIPAIIPRPLEFVYSGFCIASAPPPPPPASPGNEDQDMDDRKMKRKRESSGTH
ncbi:PREDICTED: uncharacterized protein LOC109161100 isoform X1 [Ipomoea nil]|uniref:uncharacterized protein LOC109161100 isoform X1 n=1 Tax=Ipomoea nil TaxID=35883 RepID=UPI000901C00C|nr:PREDICTED: uncharacterized protein LOC109161100 isoform X1 [Ipomoea nil]